jgi:hypothetical protein
MTVPMNPPLGRFIEIVSLRVKVTTTSGCAVPQTHGEDGSDARKLRNTPVRFSWFYSAESFSPARTI